MQNAVVRFKGEKGVDRGGLTREAHAMFYDQLDEFYVDDLEFLEILKAHSAWFAMLVEEGTVKDNKVRLFKKQDELSTIVLPIIFCNPDTNEKVPMTKNILRYYYNIGRFFMRTLLEDEDLEVRVPSRFSNNIFIDFVLNIQSRFIKKPVCEIISDITAYDPSFIWISKKYENSDECNPTTTEILHNEDCTPLDNEYAWRRCLASFVDTHIIEQRREQMEAMQNGFLLLGESPQSLSFNEQEEHDLKGLNIRPFIEICSSAKEIRQLISSEEEDYDADRIMELTAFKDFGKEEGQQKGFFYQALNDMTQKEIREVISFITAWPYLPSRSRKGKCCTTYITVEFDDGEGGFNRYPNASTCDKKLYLPRYRTAEEMKEKLLIASENRTFSNK